MADHDARDHNVGGEILCNRVLIGTSAGQQRPTLSANGNVSYVSCRKEARCNSLRRHRQRGGPNRPGEGPEGRRFSVALHGDVAAKVEGNEVKVDPRVDTKRAPRDVGNVPFAARQCDDRRSTRGFERPARDQRRRLSRPPLQGRNLQVQLGYSHDIVIYLPTPDPGGHHDRGAQADRGRRHRYRWTEGRAWSRRKSAHFRKPEPYKGKGVKFAGEYIFFRKEGKKK